MIAYRYEFPDDAGQLVSLYEALGWNSLGLSARELEKMCRASWHAVYAYDGEKLIGMGRVISDGVITGVICGLGVLPSHQSLGIGKVLMEDMISRCEENGVIPQLMCAEPLQPYYESMGFETFSVGMTKRTE